MGRQSTPAHHVLTNTERRSGESAGDDTHEDTMKTIRMTAVAAVLALGGGGLWYRAQADAHEAPAYRTATVDRGSIKSTVSATGTLNAVRTVQIGTQASGQ